MVVNLTLSSERNLLAHLSWGLKHTQALMQGVGGGGVSGGRVWGVRQLRGELTLNSCLGLDDR